MHFPCNELCTVAVCLIAAARICQSAYIHPHQPPLTYTQSPLNNISTEPVITTVLLQHIRAFNGRGAEVSIGVVPFYQPLEPSEQHDSIPALSYISICCVLWDKRQESNAQQCQSGTPHEQNGNISVATFFFEEFYSEHVFLHSWAQISSAGGKIQNSDGHIVINSDRSVDSGFSSPYGYHRNSFPPYLFTELGYGLDACKNIDLRGDFGLQRAITWCCFLYDLSGEKCFAVALWALDRALRLDALWTPPPVLPPVQPYPSSIYPFVFFHVEKTAGTFIRRLVAESAQRHHLEFFIPCHGGVFCVQFSLPDDSSLYRLGINRSRLAVLAGHFSWGIWKDLPSIDRDGLGDPKYPSCLVMHRHPVSRVISYYYKRVLDPRMSPFDRPLNELTVDELQFLLANVRHPSRLENGTVVVSDDGLSDAACRALSDTKVTTGFVLEHDSTLNIPPRLHSSAAERAVANSQKCLAGIQEDMNSTVRMISFWFPWINLNEEIISIENKGGRAIETLDTLRSELIDVIVKENGCDMLLYDEARHQFNRQLNVINNIHRL